LQSVSSLRWNQDERKRWIREKIRRWKRREGKEGMWPRLCERGLVMDVWLWLVWCLSITRRYPCVSPSLPWLFKLFLFYYIYWLYLGTIY
jgi:hypothetical protein